MEKYIIGNLIRNGKKERARAIFYAAFSRVLRQVPNSTVQTIMAAIFDSCAPIIVPVSARRGRTSYILPRIVSDSKAWSIACKWLVQAARKRPERTMVDKLSSEVIDILDGKGYAVKKKIEVQRQAVSNRFLIRNSKPKSFFSKKSKRKFIRIQGVLHKHLFVKRRGKVLSISRRNRFGRRKFKNRIRSEHKTGFDKNVVKNKKKI